MLPDSAFVLGRSTMNIAVGVMQIVGYGLGGILLEWLSTRELFLTAAALGVVSLVLVRTGIADHPPRATGRVVERTRLVNRTLLRSPVIRPVYLALWVPNGLVVGCESLFIPYAHHQAGYLLAGTAAGMLFGDVVVGRFVGTGLRDRLIEPLRLLLALPYVVFLWSPPLALALVAAALASIGYAAGLGLQERLVSAVAPDMRGHALGLRGTGMMVMQAVGALVAGAVADLLGPGSAHAAQAVGIMALASVVVTVALVPGLARSRPADPDRPALPPPGTKGTPGSPPAHRTARPER
jgi:MFS family permease